jgi:hypothetical protein
MNRVSETRECLMQSAQDGANGKILCSEKYRQDLYVIIDLGGKGPVEQKMADEPGLFKYPAILLLSPPERPRSVSLPPLFFQEV